MNKKAFTLIELLVAISIVGILSGLVVVSMNGAMETTKDSTRKNDINTLRGIILTSQIIEDDFPVQAIECEIGNNCTNLHSILVPDHFTTLSAIPKDPSGAYYKYQSDDGSDFTIKATLSTTNIYQYNHFLGFSEEATTPSSTKAIASFNFATPNVTGVINELAKTVSLTVPFGTNVTALVPTITITGASISPASGVARNFTSPVTYTVTAADATTQAYVVTVTIDPGEEYASTCVSGGGLTCTETINGSYVINTFTLSGSTTGTTTWEVPVGVTSIEYLVVAGGGGGAGGGAAYPGGGGGAGGTLTESNYSVSGTINVTVGAAGGGGAIATNGTNGENSILNNTIIAIGGGGGGQVASGTPAPSGGSGGGGRGYCSNCPGGSGVSGQGYVGGLGANTTSTYYRTGGGGGGASMAGYTGNDLVTETRGRGGDGITSSISGTSTTFAGGGGGGSYSTVSGGIGGAGGGGNGAYRATGKYNGSSATGYGSGGGGAALGSYVGGNGSAGIIIIKYLHP